MGEAFRAVFWFAGVNGAGGVEGRELTFWGRGDVMTVPKGEKVEGWSGRRGIIGW